MTTNSILAILQQSEYDYKYFSKWWQKHHEENIEVEPENETLKFKVLKFLYSIFFFIPMPHKIKLILWIVSPAETLIRNYFYAKAKKKLAKLKANGLVIVAVAGSYGKTSTKHSLYHLLKSQREILITPKSVNTPLGISRVILNKLESNHELFIVELGEYYRGDISTLAKFIQPDYGIVTPIGRQHLERMGSLEEIAHTIGELIDYFVDKAKVIVSDSNKKYYKDLQLVWYGTDKKSDWQVTNAKVSRRGTDFTVKDGGGTTSLFTPLYGEHQTVNLLPGFWLSQKLKLDPQKSFGASTTVPYISRRLEPSFGEHDILILDNSYNTNPDSIDASLAVVKQLKASKKIIVTLGFSELGQEANQVHFDLGKKLAKYFDYVGLIQSENTQDIIDGFTKAGGKKEAIVIGKNMDEAFTLLQPKVIRGSLILFEGGYREILV